MWSWLYQIPDVKGRLNTECFPSYIQEFEFYSWLYREPVKFLPDVWDVIMFLLQLNQTCSRVLCNRQFVDMLLTYAIQQGILIVQMRCHSSVSMAESRTKPIYVFIFFGQNILHFRKNFQQWKSPEHCRAMAILPKTSVCKTFQTLPLGGSGDHSIEM